jgi:hypothetical protein
MATFAMMEMRGMTMSADPKLATMPPSPTSSPVSVLFVLKEGREKGGNPASMLPVRMKLKFVQRSF